MRQPAEKSTVLGWSGGAVACGGLVCLIIGLAKAGLLAIGGNQLVVAASGFGPFLNVISNLGILIGFEEVAAAVARMDPTPAPGALTWVGIGSGLWVVGWAFIAAAQRAAKEPPPPSIAAGAPLHPRVHKYRDFYFGTLACYGLGMLGAELAFIISYMVLPRLWSGVPPVAAFVWSFGLALLIASVGGFLGAARARRLAIPEATMAVIYSGLPVPAILTAMHHVPQLNLSLAYRLREIVYLSSLLGEARPEMGYWLVAGALSVGLFIGISLGFVLTSSGRFDLKSSYERFIATRHVAVFRPRILGGVAVTLLFGAIPPVLIYLVMKATEKAVEGTRIRHLGLRDPLAAAEATNEAKAREWVPTELMTAISVTGVGLGVMALIIVLSVMSGFEADLQKKILGTHAHGVVHKYSPDIPQYQEVMTTVGSVAGVIGQTPFIMSEVMISSEGNITGSMIKGIDPETVGTVTDLPTYLLPGGELAWLSDPSLIRAKRLAPLGGPALDERPAAPDKRPPNALELDPLLDLPPSAQEGEVVLPGIVLGRELAASLKVVVGDRLSVVSPVGGELGPHGPMPKSRPFRVAGIFYSGMYEYDSKFVYIHLREAQTFFNINGAMGIEIKVADVDDARSVMKTIYDRLGGYPFRTKDWGEMNRNLFSALRLEKLVMAIILSIIVVVAAFLIIATVIMLVLEKRKEIAVLKALGVPDGGVVKIFLAEGLQIGVTGGLLGLLSGLAWCLFIERVGIKLDPQVYYIPALPVRIEPFQTGLAVVIAILVTFLASIYPALKASQVEPVDGLKSE